MADSQWDPFVLWLIPVAVTFALAVGLLCGWLAVQLVRAVWRAGGKGEE